MSNKQLTSLGITAAVLAVLTVLLYSVATPGRVFTPGEKLIPAFDPEKLGSIAIRHGAEKVTLQRQKAGGFAIAEKSLYPASTARINELINACVGVELADIVTREASNHAELGVDENGADAVSITFGDTDGKTIAGIVKGKTPEGAQGPYLRRAGKEEVYLAKEWLSVNSTPTSFMETNLVESLTKDTVKRTVFTAGAESYTIAKNEDKVAVMSPVPDGKRGKKAEMDGMLTALSYLAFSDVRQASELADLAWEGTVLTELENGRSYTVEFAKKDDKHYLRIKSAMWKEAPESITRNEPKEELAKKEEYFTARDAAEAFTKQHSGWIYEVASYKADRFRKKAAELLEDIPAAGEPEEITASHILVSWKGCDRSKATRTQDEAKKLAADILKKAKGGSDFAELAKEHSEDPAASEGGDLGPFKRGVMAKAFEDAAWKLKVGDISDLVETPFGYHIIKRTK